MPGLIPPSGRVTFRSLESAQLEEIHRRQNGECREEVSDLLDFDPPWAPMSLDQVKAKIDEKRKEERTAMIAVWADSDGFVGMGYHTAAWDTWCPQSYVIIWPEHRRKGYGREAATLLLAACFEGSLARAVACTAPGWNPAGAAFAESLGFKKAGVQRRAGIRDGRFYDSLFFDILRDEYLALRPQRGDR